LYVPGAAIPTLGNYHAWLERLWPGGIVRSELSGPKGAIAECNTPGPKVRCLLNAICADSSAAEKKYTFSGINSAKGLFSRHADA